MTIEVRKDFPESSQPIISFFANKIAPPIIRNSVKTFIHTINLDEFKVAGRKHLEEMTDEKFQKEFSKVFSDINKLGLIEETKQLGLKSDLTREEAIVLIENQTKEQLLLVADSISNESISLLIDNNFFSRSKKSVNNEKALLQRLSDIKKRAEEISR